MGDTDFLIVDVEANDACADSVQLRFKRAGETRALAHIRYESEDGLAGTWSIAAMDIDDVGSPTRTASVTLVEDSSAGEALLVTGGRFGLRLQHPDGTVVREPYLVLARDTPID